MADIRQSRSSQFCRVLTYTETYLNRHTPVNGGGFPGQCGVKRAACDDPLASIIMGSIGFDDVGGWFAPPPVAPRRWEIA